MSTIATLPLVTASLILGLVVRQARLGTQLILAGLLVVVENLAEHLEHHLAFLRKHVF